KAEICSGIKNAKIGLVYYGTSSQAMLETKHLLQDQGVPVDLMRIKAFPFDNEIEKFITEHQQIFLIEQNRDAQMRTLLCTELVLDPNTIQSILCFDGLALTAKQVVDDINDVLAQQSPEQEVG
ncbi:MAG: 2-oxoacid:acceptor oxidoreductase subunit alpha, partial [Thalassotalea sp.]|nr:2-oxoacid:acceptor oxidoreductase subunit alpha [Thalassotalea sp.]